MSTHTQPTTQHRRTDTDTDATDEPDLRHRPETTPTDETESATVRCQMQFESTATTRLHNLVDAENHSMANPRLHEPTRNDP